MDKRKFKIALAVFLLSYIAVLVVTKVLPYYKFKTEMVRQFLIM